MPSYIWSDIWLIPPPAGVDYSLVIPNPTLTQESDMARYLHIAYGALLLSLACVSTYVLVEGNALGQASVYTLR